MSRTYFWNVGNQAVSNATLKELLLKNKKSPIRILKKRDLAISHTSCSCSNIDCNMLCINIWANIGEYTHKGLDFEIDQLRKEIQTIFLSIP